MLKKSKEWIFYTQNKGRNMDNLEKFKNTFPEINWKLLSRVRGYEIPVHNPVGAVMMAEDVSYNEAVSVILTSWSSYKKHGEEVIKEETSPVTKQETSKEEITNSVGITTKVKKAQRPIKKKSVTKKVAKKKTTNKEK